MRYATKNLNDLVNWVGFEPMLSQIDQLISKGLKQPNWPPYNVLKLDDTNYVIEMAVAGFDETQLTVTAQDNTLTVSGDLKTTKETGEYVYKGLAERSFNRAFTIADNVEIGDVTLSNGILKIVLTKIIPEEKKPRILPINGGKVNAPQLLTE